MSGLSAGSVTLPGAVAADTGAFAARAAALPGAALPGLGLGQPPAAPGWPCWSGGLAAACRPDAPRPAGPGPPGPRGGGQLRRRWHRSLQLRVVATTLVICVVVVTVLGFFLVQQIESGLLNSARTAAAHQLGEGLNVAKNERGLEGSPGTRSSRCSR